MRYELIEVIVRFEQIRLIKLQPLQFDLRPMGNPLLNQNTAQRGGCCEETHPKPTLIIELHLSPSIVDIERGA